MDAASRPRLLRAGVAVLGAAALVAGVSVAAAAIPLRDESGTSVGVTSIDVIDQSPATGTSPGAETDSTPDAGDATSGSGDVVPPGDQPGPSGVPSPSGDPSPASSGGPGPQPVRPVPPVELDAP